MSVASKVPNVARAGLILVASQFLSRVLGIVRDIIMAWKFGQNSHTDAYRFAFQIPDLLFFLVAGGALSSAFIPIFSEYFHTGREKEAWKLFSTVTTLMSIVVLVFITAAWIFATPLAHLIAPKQPEIVPLIARMSQIVLPAQFAFFIGGLMFGTLYSRHVFAIPGLGPNVYNLGIIFGALVISHFVVPGIVGMSWGALIGAAFGSFLIPLWAMRRLGSEFKPSLDFKHPGVKKVFKLMLPVVLGLSLPSVYALIIQYFGGLYRFAGLNSALDFSNKLMQVPLGIFGQALALAAFPTLAQFFVHKEMNLFRAQLGKTLSTVLYLAIPVSVLLATIPNEIVATAFQHGAFKKENTAITGACLQMFAIGVAAWCVQPVLMRAYFAMQQSLTPILMGTGTTIVFVGVNLWMQSRGFGYTSLPLVGSICAIGLAVLMIIGVQRSTADLDGSMDLKPLLRTLGQSLGACVPGALLLLAVNRAVHPGARGSILLLMGETVVEILIFTWIYFGLTRLLKMPETAYLDRAMKRRPPPEAELIQ